MSLMTYIVPECILNDAQVGMAERLKITGGGSSMVYKAEDIARVVKTLNCDVGGRWKDGFEECKQRLLALLETTQ